MKILEITSLAKSFFFRQIASQTRRCSLGASIKILLNVLLSPFLNQIEKFFFQSFFFLPGIRQCSSNFNGDDRFSAFDLFDNHVGNSSHHSLFEKQWKQLPHSNSSWRIFWFHDPICLFVCIVFPNRLSLLDRNYHNWEVFGSLLSI